MGPLENVPLPWPLEELTDVFSAFGAKMSENPPAPVAEKLALTCALAPSPKADVVAIKLSEAVKLRPRVVVLATATVMLNPVLVPAVEAADPGTVSRPSATSLAAPDGEPVTRLPVMTASPREPEPARRAWVNTFCPGKAPGPEVACTTSDPPVKGVTPMPGLVGPAELLAGANPG